MSSELPAGSIEDNIRDSVGPPASQPNWTVIVGEPLIPTSTSASTDEVSAPEAVLTATQSALSISSLNVDDVKTLRELGLLRENLSVGMDRRDLATFGSVYDNGRNLAPAIFESRTLLQQRCREYARKVGFSLKVGYSSWHKDQREGNARYVCKLLKGQQQIFKESRPNCPFYITVYGIRDEWKVTRMCLAHDHYRHAGFQEDTFVEGALAHETTRQRRHDVPFSVMKGLVEREMLPAYSGAWETVKGKSILDFLLSKQISTNRQTASKIKRQLLEKLQGDMLESCQKLESYIGMVAEGNPKTHFNFEKTPDGIFKRVCVFPSSCLQASQHCKHVIGLDGTHLKADMNKRGVYLLATTKDMHGHIIVFGLALVMQEDYDNWIWFVKEMKTAFCSFESMWEPVFVSDRQKGLLASVSEVYNGCGHRFCVRHIITNVEKKGSKLTPNEQALIFQMARSECENDYNYYSSRLGDTRPLAVEYLNGIDKAHWVTYAFNESHNQPSYDAVTSNLSESANNWLGNSCRSSYPKQAFEQYFLKVVEQFADRRREACRGNSSTTHPPVEVPGGERLQELAPVYKAKLDRLLALTKALHIVPCLEGQYMVRFTDVSTRPDHAHMWRTVNLHEHECTCRRWQDERFPCMHAIKAAIHHGTHITDLFDFTAHSSSTYQATYFYQFLPQVRTSGIKQDKTIRYPDVVIAEEELGKRGRKPGPKSKHKRKVSRPGSAASPQVAMTQ